MEYLCGHGDVPGGDELLANGDRVVHAAAAARQPGVYSGDDANGHGNLRLPVECESHADESVYGCECARFGAGYPPSARAIHADGAGYGSATVIGQRNLSEWRHADTGFRLPLRDLLHLFDGCKWR